MAQDPNRRRKSDLHIYDIINRRRALKRVSDGALVGERTRRREIVRTVVFGTVAVVFTIAVLVSLVFLVRYALHPMDGAQTTAPATDAPPPADTGTHTPATPLPETGEGLLVLIDGAHPVSAYPAQEALTSLSSEGTAPYFTEGEILLLPEAAGAFENMARALMEKTGRRSLVVTAGYRDEAAQTQIWNEKCALYGEDAAVKYAARAGETEHHLGTSLDVSAAAPDGMATALATDPDVYTWLSENAHRFGFVFRYPADKTAVTGVTYETSHLRYVGVVHAAAMHARGECLEEYLASLAPCRFGGEVLTVTVAGEEYTLYTVPATDAAAGIPKEEGETVLLSGDNRGNYIVASVKTKEEG